MRRRFVAQFPAALQKQMVTVPTLGILTQLSMNDGKRQDVEGHVSEIPQAAARRSPWSASPTPDLNCGRRLEPDLVAARLE